MFHLTILPFSCLTRAKFIHEQNLDLVGLQEATSAHQKRLSEALRWNYHQNDSANTVGITFRHYIAKKRSDIGSLTLSIHISVNNNSVDAVNFWSIHLNACHTACTEEEVH